MSAPDAVLVVDDEAVVRRFLVRVLERAGYAARGAGTAEEALEALAAAPFRLLVADVHLETMSGPDLARAARRAAPGLGVLLLTGDHALADDALRRDAPVLLKPFTAEELLAAVGRALPPRGPAAQ